jgi:hypothetical protein
MESQLRLMRLVDQFFDVSLRNISSMLDSQEGSLLRRQLVDSRQAAVLE